MATPVPANVLDSYTVCKENFDADKCDESVCHMFIFI